MLLPVTATLTVAACCALYGLGSWARLLNRAPQGTWPSTIGLGLAVVILIGGVLNAAHAAFAPVLWAVAGGAFASFCFLVFRRGRALRPERAALVWSAFVVAVAAAVGIFAAATQLPPSAYNWHDDFLKYFTHPVRMLETGTIFGSPFNAVGSDTLGGQAFLQAVVLSAAPLAFINAVDPVFCLVLCVLIVGGIAIARPAARAGAIIGMAAVIAINPQYVNISSTYSGAALIACLIVLTGDPRERAATDGAYPAALVGLLYAALIALKTTFALFVVLHVLLTVGLRARATGTLGHAAKTAIKTSLWTALCLAPWIATHAPYYVYGLRHMLAGGAQAFAPTVSDAISLFSTHLATYDGRAIDFTVAAAAVLLCAVAILIRLAPSTMAERAASRALLAGAAATAIGYVVIVLVVSPRLFGYEASFRYYAPVFIGTVPVILALSNLAWNPSDVRSRVRAIGMPAIGILVLGLFASSALARIEQAARSGSILAFTRTAEDPRYLAITRRVMSEENQARMQKLQRLVPAGQPILALVGAPFALDFARNPILDLDWSGLALPWAHEDALATPVTYVLWEFRGANTHPIDYYQSFAQGPGARHALMGHLALALISGLEAQAARSESLYADATTILFRTPEPIRLP
jgi:hypothetical protein